MKYFVDGGPAQQVIQFQPTFSPAQQGLGSLQQAPNIPAMEGSPTDYSAAPTQQYTPTTSYSAPAAMTAGLGSYMEGLKYKSATPRVYTAGAVGASDDTTSPSIYDPVTQTYKPNPRYVAPVASAVTPSNRRVDTTGGSGSGGGSPGEGGGDFGGYGGMSGDQSGLGATSVGDIGPSGLGSGDYGATSGDAFGSDGGFDGGIDGGYGGDGVDGGGGWARGGFVPQGIASLGRGQDSMLVHMTPGEVQGLQKLAMSQGGSLTINPQTGLPEAGFLSSMLPTLIGAALAPATGGASLGLTEAWQTAALVGAGTGLLTGSLKNGLMAGLGAYGGASLGGSLASMGAEQAKQLAANEAAINGANIAQKGLISSGNEAADLAFRQTAADQATANQAYQASLNDRALGIGATYNPPQPYLGAEQVGDYGTFTQPDMPQAPKLSLPEKVRDAALEHAELDRRQFGAYLPSTPVTPQTYSPATQAALARGPAGNAFEGFKQLGSKEGIKNLGGKLGYAGVAGLAAPLLSSAINPPFNPPANKPTQYVRYGDGRTPGYTPPMHMGDGIYRPAFYGPESVYNSAQGGAVGYRQGGIADFYPLTGDRPNTGGLGGAAEKPRYSREINDPDSGAGINNDKAGEGPYSDAGGIYTNTPSGVEGLFTKTSAATLSRYKNAKNAAVQAAAIKELRKRATAVDAYGDDTISAAQGGLMGTYAAGGKLLRGPGDGMSDSIPAVINGARPQRAALADGEFVIPADVVSHLGNGSTEAGSKRLYSMMDKVRKARTGNPKQGKQINPDRFMPA